MIIATGKKTAKVATGVRFNLLAAIVRNSLAWGNVIQYDGQILKLDPPSPPKDADVPGCRELQAWNIKKRLESDPAFCAEMMADHEAIYIATLTRTK
jgi:hypothetical protein